MSDFSFLVSLRRFCATIISEWFWVGRLTPSGTIASGAAIPPLALLSHWGGSVALWSFALLSFVVGWIAVYVYQQFHGRHDHPQIVIDEVCGMSVALSVVLSLLPPGWLEIVLAFVLFRLFDIAKPYPIHVLDKKIPGALGVMIDDVVAGLYAGLMGLAIMPWLEHVLGGV